jgi:hypothetical protein
LSSNPRPKLKASSLKRARPDTRFYVDYDWWEKSNLDLKTYLRTRLSVGDTFDFDAGVDEVDLVDSYTGEVRRVDGFQYALQNYFGQLPDDFTTRTSLVDAVFCVLLANANQPMTAEAIAEQVQRPTEVILKTIGGTRIYQGIRPIFEDD